MTKVGISDLTLTPPQTGDSSDVHSLIPKSAREFSVNCLGNLYFEEIAETCIPSLTQWFDSLEACGRRDDERWSSLAND
jgi:hypothetical protein